MDDRRKNKISENDIISASEIGQYYFCSNAWYLQKCGFEPESPQIDIGIKKHEELGKIIDNTEKEIKKSNIFTLFGVLFLIISMLLLFFEVIL
jgi:hypothetical protein